jgi:2-aminobenzoate-CoA ligase
MTKDVSAQTDRFVHERLPPAHAMPQLRFERPELQFPEQLNLVEELLDKAAQKGFSDRPLLRSPRITLSYADVRERVDRIARVLVEDFKLVPGNRVLLRGGNSIGMALAWLAVVKAGLIAVATMPLLRAKELGEVIDKAQPALALCDFSLIDELQLAQSQSQSKNPASATPLKFIIPFNQMNEPGSLAVLASQKEGDFTACATAATDIALLAFTSGTTGQPKAAIHSHRDVLAACEAWPRHVLQAVPDDIVIGTPPLAFTFGLGGLLVFPMWAGASVYFHDAPYTPQVLAEVIRKTGPSICYTAPTMYRQLAPILKAAGTPPRLRLCVSAGEGLPDATRTLWRDATGIELVDGIGATEMFHIFISSAGDQVRRGAVGKVVPGYSAKVVDGAGVEVPRGTVGQLAVVGPTGCKYMADARQASYVKNGWNFPGDAFTQDADGYFFFVARSDDMIITAGYNVGAPEVEDALLKHPDVAECAVVGKPDPERGMIVKAFVVLKAGMAGVVGAPGNEADAAQNAAEVKRLQDHVKGAIAPFKYPREIEFVAALPRTETGKLQRFKLKSANQTTTQT